MQDGKIVDQGAHNDLLQNNKSYVDLLKSLEKKNGEKSKELLLNMTKNNLTTTGPSASILDLINREDRDETDLLYKHSTYGIRPQIDYRPYNNDNGKCLSEIVCVMSIIYSIVIAAAPLIFFYIAQVYFIIIFV